MDEWDKEFNKLNKDFTQGKIKKIDYDRKMGDLERDANGLEPLYPWL